jgi:hypothetical protein
MHTNLLHGDWTLDRVLQILQAEPRRPLLPALDAPEWQRVRANGQAMAAFAPLRTRAREESDAPLPPLTPELYASTPRTGSRKEFESVYFERRRQLARAVLALLLSEPGDADRPALQRSVIAKISDLMDEPAWALPAHMKTPTGIDPMVIDLFCAETANTMAELIDIFGAILPADLVTRIRARLQREIFDNYLAHHREITWTTAGMNWNAVCHQGVVGSALSQLDDPRAVAEMLMCVREYLPIFLGGFTRDGGTSEGPGYWNYGFGWFIALHEQVERRTNGRLSLVEGDAHVRAIARFGPLMQLPHQKYVNFADGPAEGILRPPLVAYLGQRLAEPLAAHAGEASYRHLARTGINFDEQRADSFYLTRVALRWPEKLDLNAPDPVPADVFMADLGVILAHGRDARGRLWDLAAKGGNNHEHHNHNDCGSYLINIDGQRLILEIGAPEYVIDFFGPRRYEFLAARSLGHSVPLINGVEQAAGSQFQSHIRRHSLSADRAEIEIDLTACYPAEAGCRSCIRTIVFDKRAGRISVSDAFELEKTVSLETAIITGQRVAMKEGQANIQAEGFVLALRPKAGTVIDRVDKHPYKAHHTGAPLSVERIVCVPAKLASAVQLHYDIELA